MGKFWSIIDSGQAETFAVFTSSIVLKNVIAQNILGENFAVH